jgi:hypothetical protein
LAKKPNHPSTPRSKNPCSSGNLNRPGKNSQGTSKIISSIMRLALLSLAAATTSGFAPSSWGSRQSTYLASSTVTEAHEATTKDDVDPIRELLKPAAINARLEAQLEKMKEKDKTSRALTKDVSAGTSTLVVPILEKMRQCESSFLGFGSGGKHLSHLLFRNILAVTGAQDCL